LLAVVGLGNPGAAYKKSRHNAGFMLLDGIAGGAFIENISFHRSGCRRIRRLFGHKGVFEKKSGPFESGEGEIEGKQFLLVKPTTFMNESGKVFSYMSRRGIVKELSELLVVVDDINLDVGRLRLREKGSAGGHKGLKNIINHLGTDEFARLRLGIGPKPNGEDLKKYVLSSFNHDEREILEKSLIGAATIVEAWLTGGFENARKQMARL
jgi:peptidyl-tRNA hydrolase, PTH1 family